MFAFIAKLLLAIGIFIASRLSLTPEEIPAEQDEDRLGRRRDQVFEKLKPILRRMAYGVSVLLVVWAALGTSFVWVTSGNIGTMKRIYFGSSLPPGHIVAMEGELGPQARILTAGFHFEPFISLLYDIESYPVYTVKNGECAKMSAKDGLPAFSGSAFAAPWQEATRLKLVNDATYFMTEGKGQRGPQTSCLMPGSYTINPFLWEDPKPVAATRVEQGTVGVIKSSVRANVDFGSFKRDVPTDNTLKVLTEKELPEGAAKTALVPVGAIGVWEEALPNGLYYINTDAYKVTMVPTVAQVYQYKGGYKRRVVNVTTDDAGQIIDKKEEPVDVPQDPKDADSAVFTKPEGWDVPQEMRVLAQVDPMRAPFVVASLGLTEANASQVIEDRVVTPIIRSVTRDVLGGAQIPFRYEEGVYEAVLDKDGKEIGKKPKTDAEGKPLTRMATEFRAVKVLDLLDQRASIEEAVEKRSKREAMKEGITINEVRLAESAIPPELLIARKREQLAQQMGKAWAQEKLAQDQRQATENSRATANRQDDLVEAQMYAARMTQRAAGRREEGKGEEDYMVSVANGQRAGTQAMGADNTLKLQMFQSGIKLIADIAKEQPDLLKEVLANVGKIVPNVVVNGGQGGGIEGAAAIFGSLMSGKPQKQ